VLVQALQQGQVLSGHLMQGRLSFALLSLLEKLRTLCAAAWAGPRTACSLMPKHHQSTLQIAAEPVLDAHSPEHLHNFKLMTFLEPLRHCRCSMIVITLTGAYQYLHHYNP
jgi:hypothetical protein